MITVFGATGYTGCRVAQALDRAGLPFRIAGRSAEKLAALSAALPSRPECVVAEARRPEALLAEPLPRPHVVINCAGPFTDLGEPVLRLAAMRGVHYLDITNELAFVYRMRGYEALARRTGAAIVPACGFEVAISDCVIAQAARAWPGPLESVDVVYVLPAGTISYGTRLSGLRIFATSWLAYRGGRWVGQLPGAAVRSGRLGGRPYRALAFPSSEAVTVPAHCRVRDIRAWLAVSSRWARVIAAVMPPVDILLRTPLGRLAALSLRHLAPPPPEAPTPHSRFAIQIDVVGGAARRMWTVRGPDPYTLTAAIAAYAAGVLHAEGHSLSGVLAPAQALDPDDFVGWLTTQGVTVEADS